MRRCQIRDQLRTGLLTGADAHMNDVKLDQRFAKDEGEGFEKLINKMGRSEGNKQQVVKWLKL